jgi:hypothetical protein
VLLGFLEISLKVQNKAIPDGQTDKWKALEPCVKAANVQKYKCHNAAAVRDCNQGASIWESEGEGGDGAGKRVMECEMCIGKDK